MPISLRVMTHQDVEAYNAGEDDQTVRWLSGGYGTVESTTGWIDHLAGTAKSGQGPQGFGVYLDDRLAGYAEYNADVRDGLEPGDINISYGVHPWARGRGVAVQAVGLMCDLLREREVGTRAALRIEVENHASIRVAEKCPGFVFVGEFVSQTDKNSPTMRLFRCDL